MEKYNFLITVTPLTKISLEREQSFYYGSNVSVPIGSLVEVSLGKRIIKGIVLKSQRDFPRQGNIKIKLLKKIVEKNFLTAAQMDLAQAIADYYLVSLGLVFKTMVPAQVEERKKVSHVSTCSPAAPSLQVSAAQKKAAQIILEKNKKNQPYLLWAPAAAGKTHLYIFLAKEMLAKKRQVLILLPELTLVAQERERYQKFFPQEEIAILHNKIAKGKIFSYWQKIKKGQIKIILGTRQAVWAPFQKLGLTIIDEAQDISFKQWDMTPRYDARKVAEKLTEIHQAQLILGSATPRIEDYYYAQKKKYSLITLPHLVKQATVYSIVDMRREYYQTGKKSKSISPISQELQEEISYYLKHQQQIMLLVNRQGMSAFSVCENCGQVLRCPRCQRALVYQKEGHYQCLHCNYRSSIFPICSHCQGIKFRNIGIGTQKVAQEIKKLFPTATIERVDTASMSRSVRAAQKLWEDFSQKKIDILVGTQMIAKSWDLPQVGLVGIIDADSLFDWPDFFTNERSYSLIAQIAGRVNRPQSNFPGKVILQTFHPENQILAWALQNNYEKFYHQEIRERHSLSYPPFSRLIKLIYRNKKPEKVHRETAQIFEKIEQSLGSQKGIRLFSPTEPLVPKVRDYWRKQIIIQLKENTQLPFKTRAILGNLKKGWVMDVDPVSLT